MKFNINIIIIISFILLFKNLISCYPLNPVQTHPREYGGNDNEFWTKKIQPFYDLPCDTTFTQNDFSIKSIRNAWERVIFGGGSICKNNRITVFGTTHEWVKDYYAATPPAFNINTRDLSGRNAMYIIRFVRTCLALNKPAATCVFNQTSVDDLVARVINLEFTTYWSNWEPWYTDNTYKFDLGSRMPTKFWSIFLDTFWNDLTPTQRDTISTKLDTMMVNYNACYDNKNCWPLWNGNNWTPYLSIGATHMALARWYENSTVAETTLTNVLSILEKTNYTIASDGAFVEGLAHYTNMNMDNIMEIEFLVNSMFGIHIDNIRWDYFEKSKNWIVDSILTDSFTMDFGDSHITQFSSITPLYSMYIKEILGQANPGSITVEPCLMLRFWMNHYYYGGLESGFDFHSFLARNFSALVEGCKTLDNVNSIYTEGGNGFFKKRLASTPSSVPMSSRSLELPFSTLAMEAKYNGFPHTEADFGGIIYSAWGSRLIYDLSYGEIAKTDKSLQLDNGAAGANTLVIENAWDPSNITIINRSQFSPVRGTISSKSLLSGGTEFEYFELEGSDVYGASQVTGGWLKRFKRYGVSLPDGSYLILDSFTKKDTASPINASEYFYSYKDKNEPSVVCGMWSRHTEMSLVNGEIEIKPKCNNIVYNTASTTIGRIAGASVNGNGHFVYDGSIQYSSAVDNPQQAWKSRFISDTAISDKEARGFLLVSGQNSSSVPSHSIESTNDCPKDNKCLMITVASSIYRIEFTLDSDGYLFSCINSKVNGEFQGCQGVPSSSTSTTASSTPSEEFPSSSLSISMNLSSLFCIVILVIFFNQSI